MVGCFPIASECYSGSQCYKIDRDHDDFRYTGLTKTCYVHHGALISVPLLKFQQGVKKGDLRNNLLGHFRFVTNV